MLQQHQNSYCISIDSSKYSEPAFELILNEFYTKGEKIHAIHVKNVEKEKSFPFMYKSSRKLESCGSTFRNLSSGSNQKNGNSDFTSVSIEKETISDSSVYYRYKQFLEASYEKKANLVVAGYKENKQKNSELNYGMLNLLQNAHLPVLIVKELPQRKLKEDNGFYWLICLKNSYGKSFKTFINCLHFINLAQDHIHGVCIKSKNGYYDSDLEKKFKNVCQDKGVKKFSFYYRDNNKDDLVSVGNQLSNIINFGEEYFDFVVLGCNPSSYFFMENDPVIQVLRLAQANIFYSNGI